MHICLVHLYYWPVFSGAAIQSQRHAPLIVARGHDVWVLTPRYQGLAAAENLDGIDVIRAPIWGRSRMWQHLTFMVTSVKELLRRRSRFDLLHLHDFGPFHVIPILVAKALGKKVLYQMTIMGADPNSLLRSRGAALSRLGLHLVDGFAGLSTPLCDAFRASPLSDRPCALLPYGVNAEVYHPAGPGERSKLRNLLGLDQDSVYICFVGSIIQRKGVDVLINAFREVVQQYPGTRLLLVGRSTFVNEGSADSAYYRCQAFVDSLKAQIEKAGLSERVTFTGLTDRVADYLRASDLFVFPSRREGFGAVIIEAMATGLPCITADLGGIAADIITHSVDGYIIEGHDPNHYAQRILDLLANPAEAERVGQAARRTVEQRFRIEHVVAEYLAFCEELLANQGAVFGDRKER